MKIDIEDIKYWMDTIRNSEDRDLILESFWGGQLFSKKWLIEILEKNGHLVNANIVIHGGWNGVLASMLFNSNLGIGNITSVDIDPNCERVARSINKRQEQEGRFTAVTSDMCDYEYNARVDIIINTSCEHITQEQYMKWLDNAPNATFVLQSNNYFTHPTHVNCSNSLKEFEEKTKLKIDYAGEYQPPYVKYTRYMVIGSK